MVVKKASISVIGWCEVVSQRLAKRTARAVYLAGCRLAVTAFLAPTGGGQAIAQQLPVVETNGMVTTVGVAV